VDGVALRRLLELPQLDLRRTPQLNLFLKRVTATPGNGSFFNGQSAIEGHSRSAVTDRVSFRTRLRGKVVQIKQYAIEGNAGAPTAWEIEGTMNGRVWFAIHEVGPGVSIEGGPQRFTLPHLSGPAKVLRFTQVAPPCQGGKIALKAFDITEWVAIEPAAAASK
jgi:hypothetical protein